MLFKGKMACCAFVDAGVGEKLMENERVRAMLQASEVGPFGVATLPIMTMQEEHLRALWLGDEFIEFVMSAKELGLEILVFNLRRG